ncbi:MAG: hypothetical protein JETCAE03_32150 [Ignavibacteriaceae bacterium]|jgi:hypothetical protein|nr:MAG: hypothetical protein JETCAE03_32150 [Ignavibacteriaceae bacterium]
MEINLYNLQKYFDEEISNYKQLVDYKEVFILNLTKNSYENKGELLTREFAVPSTLFHNTVVGILNNIMTFAKIHKIEEISNIILTELINVNNIQYEIKFEFEYK